ncbi:hypothetical protein PTTG_28866 [Puccinia triticina 1-1 BBBD Race 1]|uniref:Tet-like 2OG-Fe(II) oxygenase domain-containing protein n=1 Tax=Puccinia triticina (isolate 1-1 / race 1 (BBBD)) TaxID=630390 RepID=A0A180G9E2_PUCT1|nr:hypothetical protein PTTG_28866 [Puccinia triticina 1-1 BBBD Race 1]
MKGPVSSRSWFSPSPNAPYPLGLVNGTTRYCETGSLLGLNSQPPVRNDHPPLLPWVPNHPQLPDYHQYPSAHPGCNTLPAAQQAYHHHHPLPNRLIQQYSSVSALGGQAASITTCLLIHQQTSLLKTPALTAAITKTNHLATKSIGPHRSLKIEQWLTTPFYRMPAQTTHSIHFPAVPQAILALDTLHQILTSFFGSPRKQICPGRAAKRWARFRETAYSLFTLPENNDESTPAPENDQTSASVDDKTFYYFVPPSRQHDPKPEEILTSNKTLQTNYQGLSHGTCVIAPRGKPAFCKFTTILFSSMSSEELQGWEKLVCFFLNQTQYVGQVQNNGPLMGGWMWGCGWRKGMKKEGFGQFCSVGRLAAMIRKALYNTRKIKYSVDDK